MEGTLFAGALRFGSLSCETFDVRRLAGMPSYVHTRNWLMMFLGGRGHFQRQGMTFPVRIWENKKVEMSPNGISILSLRWSATFTVFSMYRSDHIGRKLPTPTFLVRVLLLWLRKATR